jgi:acetyltransferase-like isoleucine patch superfamily enzyme
MISKLFNFVKYKILGLYGFYIFRKRVTVYGTFTASYREKIFIGTDCRINEGVYIAARNRVTLGNNVVLSVGVMILDSGLDMNLVAKGDLTTHSESFVVIEDNVWVGARAILLPGVVVGKNSVIAAGSVVTKNVLANTLVAGNPARQIRQFDSI